MTCEKCVDGWIFGEGGVRECECRQIRKMEGMLSRAGLPQRYVQASFETYDTTGRHKTISAAAMVSRRYVEQFLELPGYGVLFTGSVGVGKTHLAIAIIRQLTLKYGRQTYFTDFRELLKKMQGTFDKSNGLNRDEVMRPVMNADVCVIDELGAARLTDWTFEVAEEIINARYNNALPTIFTTNLPNKAQGWTPDKAAGGYGSMAQMATRVETLGDRIGTRMFSRMQEMCICIEMSGEDYRETKGIRNGKAK